MTCKMRAVEMFQKPMSRSSWRRRKHRQADAQDRHQHQPFRLDQTSGHHAGNRHQQQGGDPPDAEGQPRGGGVIAQQRLGELRQKLRGADQQEPDQEHQAATDTEAAIAQQADIHHRLRMDQLPEHQRYQAHDADHAEGHDETRGKSVIDLVPVQQDLQACRSRRRRGSAQARQCAGPWPAAPAVLAAAPPALQPAARPRSATAARPAG